FLLAIQRFPGIPIWVVEGKEDLHFYSQRVRHRTGKELHPTVIAQGRDNLLRLREHSANAPAFAAVRALFFLDQDYNLEILPADNRLYVTPCYSIENCYVSETAFLRILREAFGLTGGQEGDQSIRIGTLYATWLNKFCEQ